MSVVRHHNTASQDRHYTCNIQQWNIMNASISHSTECMLYGNLCDWRQV